MKQYFLEKFSTFKEWLKKEKWFLLLLATITTFLFVSMFTQYALIAVFVTMIAGSVLFNFEKGLCIFLFTCAFESVFYVDLSGKNFFTYTIFYSILFSVYLLKYFISILKKKNKINLKILIPFILCVIYIILPINPIKLDDLMKYVVAFGVIYLMIDQKEKFNFDNILIIVCLALTLSIFMSYFIKFSDRMALIVDECYDESLLKKQAMFKNPNFLVEYSLLVLASLLYKIVFSDILWILPILIFLPYTYKTLSRNYMLSLIIIYFILFIFVCIKHKKQQIFKFLGVVLTLIFVCMFQLLETKIYINNFRTVYKEACELVGAKSNINMPYIDIEAEKKQNSSSNQENNSNQPPQQIQPTHEEELWIDGTEINPGRAELWKRYYRDFSSSPKKIIFGVGISPQLLGAPPHNSFVNLVWQFGIIGTLLVATIFWLIFKEMLKGKNLFSILLTCLICFINMCEGNVFNYLAIIMVFFIISSAKSEEKKYIVNSRSNLKKK